MQTKQKSDRCQLVKVDIYVKVKAIAVVFVLCGAGIFEYNEVNFSFW
ncbi:hypothetical protein [Nostoc commune]|nr:hypothetical protein [Nostoc commune]